MSGKKWYIILLEWEKVGNDNRVVIVSKVIFIFIKISTAKKLDCKKSHNYVYWRIHTLNR
jgi:hypothetical protein